MKRGGPARHDGLTSTGSQRWDLAFRFPAGEILCEAGFFSARPILPGRFAAFGLRKTARVSGAASCLTVGRGHIRQHVQRTGERRVLVLQQEASEKAPHRLVGAPAQRRGAGPAQFLDRVPGSPASPARGGVSTAVISVRRRSIRCLPAHKCGCRIPGTAAGLLWRYQRILLLPVRCDAEAGEV